MHVPRFWSKAKGEVEHRGETQALPLMRMLDEAGVPVSALHVAHPSLDDVFLTLTGRSLRDAPAA